MRPCSRASRRSRRCGSTLSIVSRTNSNAYAKLSAGRTQRMATVIEPRTTVRTVNTAVWGNRVQCSDNSTQCCTWQRLFVLPPTVWFSPAAHATAY